MPDNKLFHGKGDGLYMILCHWAPVGKSITWVPQPYTDLFTDKQDLIDVVWEIYRDDQFMPIALLHIKPAAGNIEKIVTEDITQEVIDIMSARLDKEAYEGDPTEAEMNHMSHAKPANITVMFWDDGAVGPVGHAQPEDRIEEAIEQGLEFLRTWGDRPQNENTHFSVVKLIKDGPKWSTEIVYQLDTQKEIKPQEETPGL